LKALGMVFSARQEGNCHDCVSYCLQQLERKGVKTRIVKFSEYKVSPCSSCKYECFSDRIRGTKENCPINDDLSKIYKQFEKANMVVLGIPTYVGHVPALYRAWEERSLGIYGFDRFYRILEGKTYGFIVIGNYFALSEALYRFHSMPVTWILLRSREYGLDPLERGLLEISDVKSRLDRFVMSLMNLAKEKT
jgi:multimeric flavodoxin WrbA